MSLLFSKVKSNISEFAVDTNTEYDPHKYLYENAILDDNEYTSIILDSFRATYMGLKDVNRAIIYEGFTDTARMIISWFRKWLERFKNFAVLMIKKIYDWVSKATVSIGHYNAANIVVKPFKVQGFTYSFDTNDLDTSISDDIIKTTNLYLNQVINREADPKIIASYAVSEISSNAKFNEYRGRILGLNALSSDDFIEAVKKSFRNGESEKHEILCDKNTIQTMCNNIERFKILIKAVERQKKELENVTEQVIRHINSLPGVVRDFDVYRSGPTGNVTVKSSNGEPASESDKEIYRCLTLIYGSSNSAIQRVHIMYNTFFSEKVIALNEAIRFYMACVNKARRGDG